jgi:hypothetical protein
MGQNKGCQRGGNRIQMGHTTIPTVDSREATKEEEVTDKETMEMDTMVKLREGIMGKSLHT